MTISTSMGAHKLEVRKGDRNSLVDLTAPLSTSDLDNLVAGRACHLADDGTIVPGTKLGHLTYFAWSGLDANNSPDVDRPASGSNRGMPYSGQARFGTISQHAACELSTTEFIASGLVPGALLTAVKNVADGGSATTAGKLKLAVSGDEICGRVAPAGVYTGPDGYSTLAFYPTFVAGSTLPAA